MHGTERQIKRDFIVGFEVKVKRRELDIMTERQRYI